MNTTNSAIKFMTRNRGQNIGRILNNIAIILQSKKNVRQILKTIDLDRYKTYVEKHQEYQGALVPIQYGLEFHLRNIYRLGLHRSNSMNILDIGPGCGYFPYLCNYYGHHVMTIDLDTNPMYNDLSHFLGVNRKVWKVEAYQALPNLDMKFDIVTAHHICFDNHTEPDAWGEQEYTFFLKDLRDNQLTEDARVFLLLNRNKLLSFFTRIDTTYADGDRIYFLSSKKRLDVLDDKSP